MAFVSISAKKAGKKIKETLQKKETSIKEKIEMLCEKDYGL